LQEHSQNNWPGVLRFRRGNQAGVLLLKIRFYPAIDGAFGGVGFDVTPERRAVTCRIVESSGSRLLDLRTCQAMIVRARFTPARDAAGNPAPDTVAARVIWVLPED
jgi:hypothetical protein